MLQNDTLVSVSDNSKNIVNTIERQNVRLQNLIDQVLNNSLGYQEIKLRKESINTSDYLKTIINDFKLSLDSESNQIIDKIDLDKNISIDTFYFTTAILNILENAVKYGKENLKITIYADIKEVFTVVISDNGIGIPKKELPFLFDKFYRVGNKEIHNVKGLGLGLYYTNQIIKAHEGKIFVESELGKETIFKIVIPTTS
jgi:signal transduction histidine kinase